MKNEALSKLLGLVAVSRGAQGLSDSQRELIKIAARRLLKLETDTEKELAKVRLELAEAYKELNDYRSEFNV